jgi:dienelactone hydrolase
MKKWSEVDRHCSRIESMKAPVRSLLILHGTADAIVTMEDFADLAVELEKDGVVHEMIAYGGAPHAFFDGDRYRKDADEKSWRRFSEYLAETLH